MGCRYLSYDGKESGAAYHTVRNTGRFQLPVRNAEAAYQTVWDVDTSHPVVRSAGRSKPAAQSTDVAYSGDGAPRLLKKGFDVKKCFLFGAGEYSGSVNGYDRNCLAIAVDGGYFLCRTLGIEPDLIVGDFDSFSGKPPDIPIVRATVRKDDTDMILAYREGRRLGCDTFCIYGGTGGRLDHTVANMQLLMMAAQEGETAYLFDGRFTVTALKGPGKICFLGEPRGIFSAFCLADDAHGVTEIGMSYSLDNYTMRSTLPLGVSNEFTGVPASVSVEDGILILMWETEGVEIENRIVNIESKKS